MSEVHHPLSRPRSLGALVELLMISIAVFLGLFADEWRENRTSWSPSATRTDVKRFTLAFIGALAFLSACSEPPDQPGDIAGTSTKYTVAGKYTPIAIDSVTALSIENGKLSIHGASTTLPEDLPAGADGATPDPHWALTTEMDTGKKRALTFTQDEALDDFTIEIPRGTAEVHYGTLKNQKGEDVVMLAWGEMAHSFWGYVTVTPKAKTN